MTLDTGVTIPLDQDTIDDMLKNFGDEVYSVSLNIFIHILEHITTSSKDWKAESFADILQGMLANSPGAQGKLIVRRERDIGKGTGTLLSPTDRALGKQFVDMPVLTMYKVTGNKGWEGRKIWIPNIKLPGTDVYYCV